MIMTLIMLLDPTVAQVSLAATAKLLASIGLGGLAAWKSNLLDATAVVALSRLTYWMFQPAFLFCSVSQTLHTANSSNNDTGLAWQAMWLMPLLAIFQIAMGCIMGRCLVMTLGISSSSQDSATAAQVRMCTAFANSGPLPLLFVDALFGSSALLQSQMSAGISFYLLAWSPLFWTLGKVILNTNDNNMDRKNMGFLGVPDTERKESTLMKVLSPPVWGSLLGLLVGLVGPLRNLFFGNGLLQPLYSALQTLGTAYLPAALLVLAGSLVGKRGSSSNSTCTEHTVEVSPRAMAAIALYRFVICPLFTWMAVTLCLQLPSLAIWMDDRTKSFITFLSLLLGGMPPAQNSVILLQLGGQPGAAAAMAKTLTVLYIAAVLPVTLLLTTALQHSGIWEYK